MLTPSVHLRVAGAMAKYQLTVILCQRENVIYFEINGKTVRSTMQFMSNRINSKMIAVRLIALAMGLFAVCASTLAQAQIKRSSTEVRAFRQANQCPATELNRGSCPGYEVDHVVALCLGGPDTVDNMQWLSIDVHRAKTRIDVSECRANRALKSALD